MNIDLFIILIFLILNLIVGVYYGIGVNTLKYYAVGDRNFSTATIAATIVATWIAGSSFSITASETYSQGLYFIIPGFADSISFFIIAYFYAPRLLQFLGKLSVADAMGSLYGRKVRCITAFSGIIPAVGNIAIQFNLLASLLSYSFGVSGTYASVISSIIVIIYASFGGIKSVTFTDVIQFFTFGIVLPIIAFIIWRSINASQLSLHNLLQDPLFNYVTVFDYKDPNFFKMFCLFIFFIIPCLDPAVFQRIAMSKNTHQISRAFMIAGVFIIICDQLLNTFIGILLKISSTTRIDDTNVFGYILDNYLKAGFKGIFTIGIMSMIMSTADSYLNAASVLLTYDFLGSLNIKLSPRKEIFLVRAFAVFIGVIALFISLFFKNLLNFILMTYSFYMPVVSVPLILSIFGFRSSSKVVLIGMLTGFCTVLVFMIFLDTDGLVPGMIANLLTLVCCRYFLKQQSECNAEIKSAALDVIKIQRKKRFKSLLVAIKNFNIIDFCTKNNPNDYKMYVLFGLFCVVVVFSQAYSLHDSIYLKHENLLLYSYCFILGMATLFIIYPTLDQKFHNKKLIAIIWHITVMFLIFINSFIAIISNLNQIQFCIFMATLIAISILSQWIIAICMMVVGVVASIKFYNLNIGLNFAVNNLQLQVIYSLMLCSCILIAFIKPKQQQYGFLENLSEYLTKQSNEMQLEIMKLSRYREEFINRLDQQCIEVFKSTYEQILNLENDIGSKVNRVSKSKYKEVINKLKVGSKYLNDIIGAIRNNIVISPITTNIKQFMYDIIDEYKYFNDSGSQILINCEIDSQYSEIDVELIKKAIVTCINYGLTKSITKNVFITIEATKIEYELEPQSFLKVRRDAINIIVKVDSVTMKKVELKRLISPNFTVIEDIHFAEVYRIVAAHYGKIKIILNEKKQLIYSIIIPAHIKEIRPKKNQFPDDEFEKLQQINNIVANKSRELLIDISKKLIVSGLSVEFVANITGLPIDEVAEL